MTPERVLELILMAVLIVFIILVGLALIDRIDAGFIAAPEWVP